MNTLNITNYEPPTAITFGNGASISCKNGQLEFQGEMEESAKLFFEFLKPFVDTYIQHELEKGEKK